MPGINLPPAARTALQGLIVTALQLIPRLIRTRRARLRRDMTEEALRREALEAEMRARAGEK